MERLRLQNDFIGESIMKKIIYSLLTTLALCVALAFAVSAQPTVTFSLSSEPVTTDDGNGSAYVITTTVVDEIAEKFMTFEEQFTYDNTIFVPVDNYDGSVITTSESLQDEKNTYAFKPLSFTKRGSTVSAAFAGANFKTNGTSTVAQSGEYLVNNTYASPSGAEMMKFYFKFAEGKSVADIKSDSFSINYVYYCDNDNIYTYKFKTYADTMTVVNNVVPKAVEIKIPVTKDDVIYLQDGTTVTTTETGDYKVPTTTGYVAVNTGKTTQAIYKIDATAGTATKVATNAILGSDTLAVRDRTPYEDVDGDGNADDCNGIRFKMSHNPATRTSSANGVVKEYGFIITAESNKVLTNAGSDYTLDINLVNSGYARKGVAWSTTSSNSYFFDKSNDNLWDIRATFYNIPLNETGVKTKIASRPYAVLEDGTYVYGEITKTSLYDLCKSIYDDTATWNASSESMKEYVRYIIGIVDGYSNIVTDEIVIDISGLYEGL